MIQCRPSIVLVAFAALWAPRLSVAASAADAPPTQQTLRIGSKLSTDSVILAEIATQLSRGNGVPAEHLRQLGGTEILFKALLSRQIDLYPEYTGTITQQLLHDPRIVTEPQIRAALAQRGIAMSQPLGFSNNYAIGMRRTEADRLGLSAISNLVNHPELRLGFSNEFMARHDGWPLLRDRYALPQTDVRGLDHDLAYRALAAGSIDATDLYSADAEIAYYDLRVLDDDLQIFPQYRAVYLCRADLPERWPALPGALARLPGKFDQAAMVAMSRRAKLQQVPEAIVAADFLKSTLGIRGQAQVSGFWAMIGQRTLEHLYLVSLSLTAAIILAVPLGILAARWTGAGRIIVAIVAVIYTIPSLALLAFMVPLLGIGVWPAMVALFLYSLLPIVRNTHTGLRAIAPPIRESAEVLGLPAWTRLWRVELPLASASILAGIQTSAVINVGTATLGALIGAGGYGEPIVTGIRLDSKALILAGAVPAALMALLVQGLFEFLERFLVPRGLRSKPGLA